MKKGILTIVIIFLFISNALAHSGRTDACGGHHDRKHGGYHVHNFSKYCACHPDAQECTKNNIDKEKEKNSDTNSNKEKQSK